MKWLIRAVVVGSIALVAVASLTWFNYQRFLESPLPIGQAYTLNVKKGSSYNALLRQLEAEGVLSGRLFMKLYGRLSGLSGKIRAGEYRVEAHATPRTLIDTLVNGKPVQYSFTIVEGSTFKEVRQQLAQHEVLEQELADKDSAEVAALLGLEPDLPEGLFLAETYSFERGTTDLELLKRANALLRQTLDAAWAVKSDGLPYSAPYEALIMASIVEKETARPDERARIAGVFVRRLKRGMRLQTDPTVIYGMGDAYKGNIRRADLLRPTPYNTYVINGLPPTPIAMVGKAAIEAALNPEAGSALYFVARGDGSHQFSDTLAAHNAAVRKFQLNRRKDYRSSP